MSGKKLLDRHNLRNTPLYKVWRGIKTRCYNKNVYSYKDYGGRGITICKEWENDFKSFNDWCFENGYKKGLQIDRINNDDIYSPTNCRFVTASINNEAGRKRMFASNKSGNIGVSYIIKIKKWKSEIKFKNKRIYLGVHENKNDAINARVNKEIELFGEQRTNFNEVIN